jgi:Tetratricopeptide repeat
MPVAHVNLGALHAQLQHRAAALASYRDAVALLTDAIRVNPEDAAAMSMLAVCKAKLGERDEARQLSRLAVSKRPIDRDIRFQAAEVAAILGDPHAAFEQLQVALARGYRAEVACKDPDLKPLRKLPESRAVLSCAK